jgi:hypothetical protein
MYKESGRGLRFRKLDFRVIQVGYIMLFVFVTCVGVSLPIMDAGNILWPWLWPGTTAAWVFVDTYVPICPRVVDSSGFPNSELLTQHLRKLRQRYFSKLRRRRCKEVKRMESV